MTPNYVGILEKPKVDVHQSYWWLPKARGERRDSLKRGSMRDSGYDGTGLCHYCGSTYMTPCIVKTNRII